VNTVQPAKRGAEAHLRLDRAVDVDARPGDCRGDTDSGGVLVDVALVEPQQVELVEPRGLEGQRVRPDEAVPLEQRGPPPRTRDVVTQKRTQPARRRLVRLCPGDDLQPHARSR
jgi:hypothetical protein